MSAIPEVALFTTVDDTHDPALFGAVDHTGDPAYFVHFLDELHKLPSFRAGRALLRDRLALRPGHAILDVGCGPCSSLLEVAEAVGTSGRLVGVDVSETMVAEARRRVELAAVPIAIELGDAQALPYPEGTFDVCYADRVLIHVPDAERVLGEMIRVTSPGGRVGVFEVDLGTYFVDSPDKETTRTILWTHADAIRHGWIGRQLPRLFKEYGLVEVSIDALPIFNDYAFVELVLGGHCARLQADGILTPAQVRAWWEPLREAEERGVFLFGLTAFIVVGTKPGKA